jgi:hypothetical protein
VLRQPCIPNRPVESLHAGVLLRLARLDVVQRDVVRRRPLRDRIIQILRVVSHRIAAGLPRQPMI